ncbi:MAG: iron-sulfur cluster assembly accessory protein [Pseudomonadota bacterium]|nr:iron-sulfur cluster assembly accessory protein [Pseudomonadota bacterium]MEC7830648.1 iron-sulfur cluster assembly accessory protein [Pseudomonadota bacterium]MEC9382616.1 iron-sulfur cluster assembly accessory protein [Pseudomonadota bacterium]MEC9481372.1 iron-sulfur cluster assembly accessory protein [Pseudomonadota bacterium]
MKNLSSKSSLISITPSALDRLQVLIDKAQEDIKAIKLGIKNGGCAGMTYTMDYVEKLSGTDEVIEINNINIIIDNSAVLFLLGTELDYEETKLNSGFVFNNPNQTDACGCGESVSLEKAEIPVELLENKN